MGPSFHFGTVLGMNRPAANQSAKSIRRDIGSGKDTYDTRCSNRFCQINAIDPGMGMGASQKIGMSLARTVQIISISPGACDEPFVFLAADSLSYSCLAHEFLLPESPC